MSLIKHLNFPALLQEILRPLPRLRQATDCDACWNTGLRGRDLCPCAWGQMRSTDMERRVLDEAAARETIAEILEGNQ